MNEQKEANLELGLWISNAATITRRRSLANLPRRPR